MFTKIDFSLVKKQIPDYGVLQLDTSRINPPNLQYKILRDGSFDFQKKNEVNKDDIINVHVDSDNSYLKNVICNMYFYSSLPHFHLLLFFRLQAVVFSSF